MTSAPGEISRRSGMSLKWDIKVLMLKVAITGTMGSGKTAVLRYFARRGAAAMSCDDAAKKELARNRPLRARLRRAFGQDIFIRGRVCRRRLARVVFADRRKLAELNRQVHPFVKRRVRAFFRKNKSRRLAAVEVPLLFETDFHKLFDVTIGVAIGARVQRQRLKRSRLLHEGIRRMRWQLPEREKLARCDFIIDNRGTRAATHRQIGKLMEDEQWLKN